MGSGWSKVSKTASSTARQYPTAASIPKSALPKNRWQPSQAEMRPGPTVHPSPSSSAPATAKDQHIELDARDPDFGSRLSRLGPVQPTPTLSNSSTFISPPLPPQVVRPTNTASPSSSSSSSKSKPNSINRNILPATTPNQNPAIRIVQARSAYSRIFEDELEALGKAKPTKGGSFQGRTLISTAEIKNLLRMRDEGGKSVEEIEEQLRLRPGLVRQLGLGNVRRGFGNV